MLSGFGITLRLTALIVHLRMAFNGILLICLNFKDFMLGV